MDPLSNELEYASYNKKELRLTPKASMKPKSTKMEQFSNALTISFLQKIVCRFE